MRHRSTRKESIDRRKEDLSILPREKPYDYGLPDAYESVNGFPLTLVPSGITDTQPVPIFSRTSDQLAPKFDHSFAPGFLYFCENMIERIKRCVSASCRIVMAPPYLRTIYCILRVPKP